MPALEPCQAGVALAVIPLTPATYYARTCTCRSLPSAKFKALSNASRNPRTSDLEDDIGCLLLCLTQYVLEDVFQFARCGYGQLDFCGTFTLDGTEPPRAFFVGQHAYLVASVRGTSRAENSQDRRDPASLTGLLPAGHGADAGQLRNRRGIHVGPDVAYRPERTRTGNRLRLWSDGLTTIPRPGAEVRVLSSPRTSAWQDSFSSSFRRRSPYHFRGDRNEQISPP